MVRIQMLGRVREEAGSRLELSRKAYSFTRKLDAGFSSRL